MHVANNHFLRIHLLLFFLAYSAQLLASNDMDSRWVSGEFKGFNLSTFKSSKLNSSNFNELKSFGVTLVRVIIDVSKNPDGKYVIGLGDEAYLERILSFSRKNRISVVITLQIQPAGNKADYWLDDSVKSQVGQIWVGLAQKYQNDEFIVGFDLLNEPVIPQPIKLLKSNIWTEWAEDWISRIRVVDPKRTIVFEPAPWALPSSFANLKPLNFDNIVYSFHSYAPQVLTHQGINGYPKGMEYGEVATGQGWDKLKLQESMLPVIKFSEKFKLPVYVGEFSIINNAKFASRVNYIEDSTDLFSSNHYSWTYHAYKEWVGWDSEVLDANGVTLKDGNHVKSVMDVLKMKFNGRTDLKQ